MAAVLRFLSELFPPYRFHACQWQDAKPKKDPFTYYYSIFKTHRIGMTDPLPIVVTGQPTG